MHSRSVPMSIAGTGGNQPPLFFRKIPPYSAALELQFRNEK
jgi:hypothetical protein